MQIIPLDVMQLAFSLSVEQVSACVRDNGSHKYEYNITSVECLGMLRGGAIVYKCNGVDLPKYIETFKLKVVRDTVYGLTDDQCILAPMYFIQWA